MRKPAKITEEMLQEAANKIADEALAPWKGQLSAQQLSVMRFLLLDELVVNPDGRLELRRSLGDPELLKSGELLRSDGDADDAAGDAGDY